MGTSQQILAIITALLLFVLVAPGVFRINMARGTTLRNVAIWLLIFVGLVWAYQFTHPKAPIVPADQPAALESTTDIPQNDDKPKSTTF